LQPPLSWSECADDDEASSADSSSSSLQLEGTPLPVTDVGTLLELALAAAAAKARRQAKATHTSLMQHHQLTMVGQLPRIEAAPKAARKTLSRLVERVMQQELEAAWLAGTFACW
jgi:hypothetical protein